MAPRTPLPVRIDAFMRRRGKTMKDFVDLGSRLVQFYDDPHPRIEYWNEAALGPIPEDILPDERPEARRVDK